MATRHPVTCSYLFVAVCSLVALTAASPLRLPAQSPCIGVAEFVSLGMYLLRKTATMTAPSDSGYDKARQAMGLPRVAARDLAVVTDSATCRRAAAAYAARAGSKGGGLSGRVLVVKAGTSYVVLDPDYYLLASNRQYTHMVMTSHFKVGVMF